MLILDLWGISFYAVVVFGLGKNILFKSILGLFVLSHAQSIVVMLFENWPRFVFFFDHQSIIFAATDGVRLKTFTA